MQLAVNSSVWGGDVEFVKRGQWETEGVVGERERGQSGVEMHFT